MLVQAAALGLLVAGHGSFAPSLAAAALLGVGTAMVHPTLIAASPTQPSHATAPASSASTASGATSASSSALSSPASAPTPPHPGRRS
jgi:hypothetical protein